MRKWREKQGAYLIEGPHLLQEAVLSPHGNISTIILDEGFHLPKDWPLAGIETYQVTHKIFTELSETETPQGIIGICEMEADQVEIKQGRFLLIDGVQDPGNLGTLIRTADAFGLDAVLLGEGCVDLYNAKTLRSAQGSHFHLPVVSRDLFEAAKSMKEAGIPLYGSSLRGQNMEKTAGEVSSFGLVVGNEGNGVTPELLAETNREVKIPMYGQAESMNVAVAAGILLYWLRTAGLAN